MIVYKTLLKTDINSNDYSTANANLKRYREISRGNIKRVQMLHYKRKFNLYQNDAKITWSVSKETLQRKRCMS